MKYLKLYISYAKISLMSKLVYKANVIIGITGFLCTQVFSLLTLYLPAISSNSNKLSICTHFNLKLV